MLAGLPLAPFHGDEADQLFKAQDYVAYFVIGDPARLAITPPIAPHSPEQLRLVTGSTNAYLTGFILYQRGTEPWPRAWFYAENVAANRNAGNWPDDTVLHWGRLASALFTAACIPLIAHLTNRIYPGAGWVAALLFATHPLILLNGRRVLQEGALMFFTLLAVILAQRNARLTGLAAGLALASKPTALIAFLGIALAKIKQMRFLLLMLLVGGLVYLALTPAIWRNPLAHTILAAEQRVMILEGQVEASSDAYRHIGDRLKGLITLPFPQTLQYYESPDFATDTALKHQIDTYNNSIWRGWTLPGVIAWSLAAIGLRAAIQNQAPIYVPWVIVTTAILFITTPLGWQRYYLPLTVALIPSVAIGIVCVVRYTHIKIRRNLHDYSIPRQNPSDRG